MNERRPKFHFKHEQEQVAPWQGCLWLAGPEMFVLKSLELSISTHAECLCAEGSYPPAGPFLGLLPALRLSLLSATLDPGQLGAAAAVKESSALN